MEDPYMGYVPIVYTHYTESTLNSPLAGLFQGYKTYNCPVPVDSLSTRWVDPQNVWWGEETCRLQS